MLERHSLSAAFGDMPDDQYADLLESIRQNGVRQSVIKVFEGKVLDGWHRYKAAHEVGREAGLIESTYAGGDAATPNGDSYCPSKHVISLASMAVSRLLTSYVADRPGLSCSSSLNSPAPWSSTSCTKRTASGPLSRMRSTRLAHAYHSTWAVWSGPSSAAALVVSRLFGQSVHRDLVPYTIHDEEDARVGSVVRVPET